MKLKFSLLALIVLLLISTSVYKVSTENSEKKLKLRIVDSTTEEILGSYQIANESIIRIKFYHSYDKGFVWEDFIVKNKKFILKEVAYAVPSYDMRDQTFPKANRRLGEDGVVYIENINKFYKEESSEFLIRVPYTVKQWIITKDQQVELSSLAVSGKLLKIDIVES